MLDQVDFNLFPPRGWHGPWPREHAWRHYTESHQCHFCGTWVRGGWESDGTRHYLSDCRPDLVEHEPGETCTWGYRDKPQNCYAYQDITSLQWTDDHAHFYQDGPT